MALVENSAAGNGAAAAAADAEDAVEVQKA